MSETRTALVTGSARGIGLACANALSRSGHQVVGVDIIEHDEGLFHSTHTVDLGDPKACAELVEVLPPVDVLVNNAAVLHEVPFESLTLEQFDETIAVNLRGPFLLTQGLIGQMGNRGWGRIVNVASVAARTGAISHAAAYAASKAGLVALTKSLARHYGPQGITVNAVLPGGINTPMAQKQIERDPDLLERVLSQIPVGRMGEGRDVGDVVAFLASDQAGFVNGVSIDVSGGWSMG